MHREGDTELREMCDFKALNYSKVTENIFLGAYVKNEEDFFMLKKEGVSSILSIQTQEDLASHSISQEYLR